MKHNTQQHLAKVLMLAFSLIGVASHTSAELMPYTSTYYATFDRFSARNTSTLSFDEATEKYTYFSYTKPRGLAALAGKIRETLVFSINDYVVTPYSYQHTSRKNHSVKYNWTDNLATAKEKDQTKEIPLSGNELDLQSMQMQLMEDMNNNSLKEQYTVIKGTDVRTYTVTQLGTENVTIGKQTYKTVKLKQQRKGSSRHTFIWLGTEIQHVTVKMEQYKGEKRRATLALTSYKVTE